MDGRMDVWTSTNVQNYLDKIKMLIGCIEMLIGKFKMLFGQLCMIIGQLAFKLAT